MNRKGFLRLLLLLLLFYLKIYKDSNIADLLTHFLRQLNFTRDFLWGGNMSCVNIDMTSFTSATADI